MTEDYFLISDNQPLIRLSDKKYPIYMPQVRSSNTQTSFPIPIRDYILEPFGYMPVFNTAEPEGDVVKEGEPTLGEDGKWYKGWIVRDYNEDELAEILETEKVGLSTRAGIRLYEQLLSDFYYRYQDKSYQLDVTQDQVIIAMSAKIAIEDDDDGTYYTCILSEGVELQLIKEEYLALIQQMCKLSWSAWVKYKQFLTEVKNITNIKDLPEIPDFSK